jgi:hypothetical protein
LGPPPHCAGVERVRGSCTPQHNIIGDMLQRVPCKESPREKITLSKRPKAGDYVKPDCQAKQILQCY